ncbi:hypothetical protein TNCV_3044481, partial [Trichonephila clavipes]
AGFTASAHAENEGVNELLRHCCPFRLAAPIEAPESLLVVRYELPLSRLENPIHARMGLRSVEIVPANPYVQYPHSQSNCSAATVR